MKSIAPLNQAHMQHKQWRYPLALTLALGLTVTAPVATAQPAIASAQLQAQRRPSPPSTPPPNRTRSGGSLSGSTNCSSANQPLVALIPAENPVLTASEHPTVLVYVPYAASEVSVGEFSVLVGPTEMTRLYRARFTLPATPGIVSVTLPNRPDAALSEGSDYHWYFKLYCAGNTTARADLDVNGWVKRVAPTAQSDRPISSTDFWYDSLASLADRLSASPQDPELQTRWRSMLQSIGAEDLADVPLVGTVQLLEN